MTLQESIGNFQEFSYTRVKRGNESYADTLHITKSELDRYVVLYREGGNAQHLRLIRDAIDHWLRRYHGYSIRGSIGSHYKTSMGVKAKNKIFEHVIPASKTRDMLLQGVLTTEQAINMPTCFVSKQQDISLNKSGRVSSSSNLWLFFERYNVFRDKITTYDGTPVDPETWTLEKHFEYFKHLKI